MMNDEIIDAGRLKIALNLLGKRQIANYTRQCREKKMIVLDQLNIALSLFNDKQTNKFTERIAIHEGFQSVPKTCKGSDCCGCKTGQRLHCPCFKQVDAAIVNRLNIRHRREKKRVCNKDENS